jgi:hypothetical protein
LGEFHQRFEIDAVCASFPRKVLGWRIWADRQGAGDGGGDRGVPLAGVPNVNGVGSPELVVVSPELVVISPEFLMISSQLGESSESSDGLVIMTSD